MHLPYDPTVGEGNYTNREEVSYRDEDYHIAPVEEKYEVFSNFLKTVKQSHKKQKLSGWQNFCRKNFPDKTLNRGYFQICDKYA